jgi:glycerophosphoryl diester phosphodiesterase
MPREHAAAPAPAYPTRVVTLASWMLIGVSLVAAILPTAASGRLIVGHRGASGHRPEHTLESYTLAIAMGADVIEPDLVSTKDGVLIARHENEIGGTTDAATKFASRKTTKIIDGQRVTGWFTEDFTLAEIKTLRANERLPFRSHGYDGKFQVPTFEEVIALAASEGRAVGREIAVYPETKHPTYFRGIGLPLEERLVAVARRHGLTTKRSPIFIQSFEMDSLKRLRTMTNARLSQLLDQGADVTPARLNDIRTYADIVAPNKLLVVPVNRDGSLGAPTTLVKDAHQAGLEVHVWTVRQEPSFLPAGYGGEVSREFEQLAGLGVDGIFTDFPDLAAAALRK